MTAGADRRHAEAGFDEPLDPLLLRAPLDFILADHLRQRRLCQVVEGIADDPSLDRRLVEKVLAFVEQDMALHVIDEEEDLFPLLRRRALPEDDLERVLGALSGEHAADEILANVIVIGLRRALEREQGGLDDTLRDACRGFATRQRRHLAVENAVVMPLAELRLTSADQKALARRFAVRRGIDPRKGQPGAR